MQHRLDESTHAMPEVANPRCAARVTTNARRRGLSFRSAAQTPLPARAERALWEGTPRAGPARKRAQGAKRPSTRARARARRGWATDLDSLGTATLGLFIHLSGTDAKVTDVMRERAKQNAAELARKVGQVEIEVPSTARVSVAGKALDEAPHEPVAVQPGKHTIEATFDGRVKMVTVDCAAGSVVKAKIEFEPGGGAGVEPPAGEGGRSRWSTGRIVTVSALSAGAIVGGVLFFVFRGKAQTNVDDAKALLNGGSCLGVTTPECTKAASLKDDRDSNVTLSTVSIIAGGAFAAGAVAAAVLWPRSGSAESARITPMVAPGVGGASFVGSF